MPSAGGDIDVQRRSQMMRPPSMTTARPSTKLAVGQETRPLTSAWAIRRVSVTLREVRRTVGIEAARDGQRFGGAVEALDLQDRLEQRVQPMLGSDVASRRLRRPPGTRARRARPADVRSARPCSRVSSDWLNIRAGKPGRTSAIGPWRSSAVLNASA